ncbi:metal-sensitive transcriptional regulator [Texcoconibacillus texcoconensis]|uniref:DNA-binding FrmR family transcriptional regulator n=1 Tax=Texcoconibacillus texcoconensis TaxID=1095777 RepID=A0A840QSH8_9BACI|nr:metal-sensitive transcriptional regulator [Texcoconibacillus texcoconensis]MBB5174227.1 DNA-binding FrmR family transcriptional regulator [Texcoconibacillus texcoconensis]
MNQYDEKVKHRLKRIEGQVKGIVKMVDEGKDCRDVVNQMSAVRNALDRAIGVVVSANLEECIREQVEKGEETDDAIKEAVELLVKSR